MIIDDPIPQLQVLNRVTAALTIASRSRCGLRGGAAEPRRSEPPPVSRRYHTLYQKVCGHPSVYGGLSRYTTAVLKGGEGAHRGLWTHARREV